MILIAFAVMLLLMVAVVRLVVHAALRAVAIVLLAAMFLFFGACSGFSMAFHSASYFAAAAPWVLP